MPGARVSIGIVACALAGPVVRLSVSLDDQAGDDLVGHMPEDGTFFSAMPDRMSRQNPHACVRSRRT
jgi:hypothetical protein